jgi:glycosyltransferase involved in cell wall biosynthesis
MKKVSIAIGVRNRKKNILKSMEYFVNQTFSKNNFEVVITDYGGNDNLEKSLKKFYSKLNIKYIYVNTNLPWNEARAKNISIRNSSYEFIICTNADILFEKNSLKEIMKIVNKNKNKKEYLYQVYRWNILKNKKVVLCLLANVGDFQGFYKKNWVKLRGYDESMTGWGGLDADFRYRWKRIIKKDEFWFDENKIKILHSFHKTKFNRTQGIINEWKMELNKILKVNKTYFGDKINISKVSSIKNNYMLAKLFNYIHRAYLKIKRTINKSKSH